MPLKKEMKPVKFIQSFHKKHINQSGIIIGGGLSLKKLLDNNYPFNKLDNYITLGLNVSFKFINTDYLLFSDTYIWNNYHKEIKELNIPVFTNLTKDDKRIKYPFPNDIIHIYSNNSIFFPLIKGDIRCNNSGSSGLSLLHYFGIKKIYLFGFDLIVTNDNIKNFHNEYDDKKKEKKLVECNLNSFYINLKKIIELLNHKYKVEVISCSENSRLNKIIPYKSPFELF
ncbi:MAG: hypothetical protein K9H48_19690 [Melioribacteraceae bacterium]|nr:hypothetical protein [Melioribacteraceae bacterium]